MPCLTRATTKVSSKYLSSEDHQIQLLLPHQRLANIEKSTTSPGALAIVPANTRQGDQNFVRDFSDSHPRGHLSAETKSNSVNTNHRSVASNRIHNGSDSQLFQFTLTVSPSVTADRYDLASNCQPSAPGVPQTSVQRESSNTCKSDPSRMATALLPQPQHHFATLTGHYSTGLFDPYEGQQLINTNSAADLTTTSNQQHIHYTSPRRWAAQQAFHRPSSKSPNIRDRTPIRHNRPDMNRHRSSSRSEVYLAYAEEQARQAQQGQAENARPTYVGSLEPSNSPYQPQQYSFPGVTSPYLSQQAYYGSTAVPATYGQLASQQEVANSTAMYDPGRTQMQLTQVPGVTLNPSETLYSQPRAPHLPAMNAVPSNFPPIPQPLESTPSEVDVVGSRQKPQCWDHGCNGRQFSTFSNLLRHQREKSGTATKARCPHCGTEFTRTTARNGHLYGGKCKGMPDHVKDTGKPIKEDNA